MRYLYKLSTLTTGDNQMEQELYAVLDDGTIGIVDIDDEKIFDMLFKGCPIFRQKDGGIEYARMDPYHDDFEWRMAEEQDVD